MGLAVSLKAKCLALRISRLRADQRWLCKLKDPGTVWEHMECAVHGYHEQIDVHISPSQVYLL